MINLSNYISTHIRSKLSLKSTKLKYSWWLWYIVSRSGMGNNFYTGVVNVYFKMTTGQKVSFLF
jgi:hypothetical protein